MKSSRSYWFWLIFSIIFFDVTVKSELTEKLQKNIQDATQKNYRLFDTLQESISEYMKTFCDVGIQFLVPNPTCASQLEFICKRNDILIQMLDASSKYSGMLTGARFDYGNFDQCLNIHYSYEYGTLRGKYCPFSFLIPDAETGLSKWDNIFKLSLCIPDGCSLNMFSNISSEFQEEKAKIDEIEALCVTKESFNELSVGNIVITSVFMIWIGIIVICTLYDIYLYTMERRYDDTFVKSFSMFHNFEKLLKIGSNSPNRVEVLEGLRAISMIWIIAGHGFSSWIDRFPSTNQVEFPRFRETIYSSYANAAHLCVDTFFYMSGFLVAFSYIKSEPKSLILQIKSVPTFYLHRYIRLTTALFILFLIGVWIYPKIGTGPVWIPTTTKEAETCKKHWWTFFLYIQNYYNYDDLCIIPTWYLSADMQMYILSPILLIPLSILLDGKGKIVASMVLLGMLNVLLTVFPMLIRYYKESENTFDTHSRLIDFSLGITMGALMQKTKTLPYLSCVSKQYLKKFSLLLWSIVLTQMFIVALLYSPAEITIDRNFNIFYFGLSKPAWCVGLCWIIYSCYHGYGGVVNWILTRPIFKMLSKLSYAMYLLHYPVIGHFILTLRTRIYFSHYTEFYLFCGYFTVTLLVSILWTLVFEYPILAIEKEFQRKKIKSKDKK